jgi:hypothetical protein
MADKSNFSTYSKYYVNLQADHHFNLYEVSSRLVTLLKFIYDPVQVSKCFVLSFCFKLINFI